MTSRRSWVAVVMATSLALLGCDTSGSSDRAEPDRGDDAPLEAFDNDPVPEERSTDRPSGELWVAPTGRDEGRGSREDPWRTLEASLVRLEPGDVLHLAEGEYREQIRYPSIRPASPMTNAAGH